MQQVRLWSALRAINKLYGMPMIAVIFGVIGALASMIVLSGMMGVIGAIPAYFVGDSLAHRLHDGRMQRLYRWYFGAMAKEGMPGPVLRFLM